MLTSLITGLIRGPQFDVIDGTGRQDVAALVEESGATVVIMPGDAGGVPKHGQQLLEDRAGLRVLALREHGSSGVVGALSVQFIGFDAISKATLLQAVAGDLGLGDATVSPRKGDAA
jgi:hypothetical protein